MDHHLLMTATMVQVAYAIVQEALFVAANSYQSSKEMRQ